MKKNGFVPVLMVCLLVACGQKSHQNVETIEMMGISEIELSGSKTVVSISFNGSTDQKDTFLKQIREGELAKFNPKLQYENMYQESDPHGENVGRFIHNLTYQMHVEGPDLVEEIAKLMEKNKIPGYLNTNGTFISAEELASMQLQLFELAIKNARERIDAYTKSNGKTFRILESTEVEEPGYPNFSLDGIVYNNRLSKKVKVRAAIIK
ncbi:hypothetical protein [Pleomorphovibrio marinus]|uniref:hypothetical protein n=1 Tax=Pleomorphovibrio marinus TaxID=2164132 RepID=UPI000E0A987E|nr:hypothetical protein [Pleomorphovibrio marinus]